MISPVATSAPSDRGSSTFVTAQLVDNTSPSISILSPVEGQVLTDLTVLVTWEAFDLGSGINHTFFRLDSGNWLNVDGLASFVAHLLLAGQHNVTLVALDRAGNQARAFVDFVVEIAPDAPLSLNATAGASEIGVSWAMPYDGGSPILSYKVFRRSASGNYGPDPIATPSVAAFFDSNITAGTRYYYVVKASNSQGDGPASSEVNATLADGPRPPDAPTDLIAKLGVGFVSLSWSLPTNQGESAVLAYKVYRTSVPGGNPNVPLATLSNAQRYFIDASLVTGEYYYKVSAISFAESPRSNESKATVDGIQPGSPGTIVSMSLIEEGNAIKLSWEAPPEGASPILRYLIYRSATPYDPVYLNSSTSASFEDMDVVNGQTLYYWIVAENAQGQGPLSATIIGTANSKAVGIASEILLLLAIVALAVTILLAVVWSRRRK